MVKGKTAMPWVIGIDEAGYGPNLGPFVMTSVACRVPTRLAGADLWLVLQSSVCRHASPADGRIVVDDSKLVYSAGSGLLHLETSVLALLSCLCDGSKLRHYVDHVCPNSQHALDAEPWFHGTTLIPVVVAGGEYRPKAVGYAEACKDCELAWGLVRCVIVCPAQFNELLDRWGTKGAVLGHGLRELVRANLLLSERDESLTFFIDKHGGRNTYAAMLQDAIPEGMIVAHEEGMARSRYRVLGLEREVSFTFLPRADSEHFCVAWASMVSKYLREVLMMEFNQFWQDHVPGLKATAGYPGDAARFYAAIRPVLRRLGIAERAIWRNR
jgi:ribonuclease HII